MALSAGCHVEVRTTGSDTICSGAFDPTQTAGMYTDGAATSANTSAPVFSSASYNFVAGDVGAYVFIGAGTNWAKGWYPIVSVASNVATLGAAALGYQPYAGSENTAAGCATVASPTGATWSIDYSQQAAAEFTCTDGTAAGAGSTLSSATIGFGKQMVGNAVRITAGTNCTTGHHVITSVAAGVATFNNAVTTGVTSDCTLYLGGAIASPGYAGAIGIAGNIVWIGPGTYTLTSATANVTNGRMSFASSGSRSIHSLVRGWKTVRGEQLTASSDWPIVKWGVNAGSQYALAASNLCCDFEQLVADGNRANYTLGGGIYSNQLGKITSCKAMNCAYQPFGGITGSQFIAIETTNNNVASNQNIGGSVFGGYFHDNAASVFSGNESGSLNSCIFDTNTGYGISSLNNDQTWLVQNCIFYGNTSGGVGIAAAPGYLITFINCIFESNGGYGINIDALYQNIKMINCAFYNNTSGKYPSARVHPWNIIGEIIPTESVFVDAANGDFRLNMKPGGGALLRGAGYPQTLPGLTVATRRDIGTVQHAGFPRMMGDN